MARRGGREIQAVSLICSKILNMPAFEALSLAGRLIRRTGLRRVFPHRFAHGSRLLVINRSLRASTVCARPSRALALHRAKPLQGH